MKRDQLLQGNSAREGSRHAAALGDGVLLCVPALHGSSAVTASAPLAIDFVFAAAGQLMSRSWRCGRPSLRPGCRSRGRDDQHARMNGCRNLRAIHAAVSYKDEILRFVQASSRSAGATSTVPYTGPIEAEFEVEAHPLTRLLSVGELCRARVIKIDVEGGPYAGRSVVERMAEIGVTVSHAVEQPEPRHATAEEIALLGLTRSALVTRIQRTYYSDEGRRSKPRTSWCRLRFARSCTRCRSTLLSSCGREP